MTTASALVYEGPENVGIREFPLPAIGPDDMLVKVDLAGVDGSEVHMLRGEMQRINDLAPLIFGDEIVGRVDTIGARAAERRGLAEGDLVVVEARWPCNDCRACLAGNYYLCETEGQGEGGTGYGWISCAEPPHLWGGYASHVFVPGEALVYRVPDGMSLKAALVCGSVLANSARWTKLARVEMGSTVVVLGPGPQGLGCALASTLRGADVFVAGLERDSERLAMAASLGVSGTVVLPAGHEESAEAIRSLTGGRPIDVVIEAAGAQASKDLAVEVVAPMGMFANISVSAPARASVDWFQMLLKEVTIVTPLAHPHAVGESLRMGSKLLERGIDPGRFVSHVFPLADAERALRTAAYEFEERPIKVAIEHVKALVKYDREPGHMEVRIVDDPTPAPDEVVVAVRACGVDRGGDLYVWKSTPGMPFAVPVIPGAENCGEVVEVGADVRGWAVGDRVVSEVIIDSCGQCEHCRAGFINHCPDKLDLGRMVDGAYAEFFTVKAHHLHRIPDGVSMKAAVLTEMAAVAAHNLVESVTIRPGDDVAVVGPGPVGLLAVQLAKAAGASRIAAVGLASDGWRLDMARSLGATHTLIADSDRIDEEFPGGFHVVAETSGSPGGVATALGLARARGTLAAIGTPVGKSVPVDWTQIALKSLTVRGTYAHLWSSWELVLAMMADGTLRTEPLMSYSEPLERWQEAFEAAERATDLVKIAVTPNGAAL